MIMLKKISMKNLNLSNDPRVKIINNKKNLGEIDNSNNILKALVRVGMFFSR